MTGVSWIAVLGVAVFAFVGTMVDNFFAFAAQLALTPPERHRRAGGAQFSGIVTLISMSALLGSLLADLPDGAIAGAALVPWALAWHGWRHRSDPPRESHRRGATTTFAVTVALGGDNLAVWAPLLRLGGVGRAAATVSVFLMCDLLFVAVAGRTARHERVVGWGRQWAPVATPLLFVALGFVIIMESGVLPTFG